VQGPQIAALSSPATEPKLTRLSGSLASGFNRQTVLAAGIGLIACIASVGVAPNLRGALGAGLALLMAAIAVVDARRFTIPNGLTASALALAFAHAAIQEPDGMIAAIADAAVRGAVLALLFLLLRELYVRLRRREGLGLGDVKLAGVCGAWLGWSMMPIAVEIAALAALAYYGMRHFAGVQSIRATSRIPFGLFLAPAIWLGWLLEVLLNTF
jgi:leader peptidase (prepilin peptidase) / N-methyltransferase